MHANERLLRPCGLRHACRPFLQPCSGVYDALCRRQHSRCSAVQDAHDHADREVTSRISRRQLHGAAMLIALDAAAVAAAAEPAAALACPGMRGRELQQCLKKARQAREAEGS